MTAPEFSQQPFRPVSVLLAGCAVALSVLLAGCGSLPYKLAGDQLLSFGKKEMVPYLMTYDDVPMLCATAESLTPLLMTFEAVGSNPDQMAVMVYMGAALCAETVAFEHEMRYLRALGQGRYEEARDARIAQKRAHALAAKRQQVSYQRFLSYYGDLPEGQCSKKLKTDIDEMIFLLGMVSGVKAMLNDVQSDNAVGVDKDIAPKILYWTQCLDNAKWWELPSGMRSTVWNFAPMLAPEGVKPMEDLARVAKVGEASGVRLAHAIWALAAFGNGDAENMRRSIREFRAAADVKTVDPRYRILDAVSTEIILGMSDRMWTEGAGTRTPPGSLGRFWDEVPVPTTGIDDLL